MFKERQKLRKTCKLVIFKKVAAAKTKKWFLRNFWENLFWEISKFCKKLRSSHQKCSIKKAVLKNFTIFTGKYLYWSLFLIKSQDWRPTTLLKGDSNTGVFLLILRNFKNNYFEKHLQTTASVNSNFRSNKRILIWLASFHSFDSWVILENSIYYAGFLVPEAVA